MQKFVVIGMVMPEINDKDEPGIPYTGPAGFTKEAAVAKWSARQIKDGEVPSQVLQASEELMDKELNTRVTLYDGDEVVIVTELSI